ncbi:MAG: molybdopterin-binding protein [Pseudomonadota bacterium]|nr:molybdopterin-binding protein [Pseudomonadota bacterium]
MRIGAVIIGDELLSGRRTDQHMAHTIEALGKRGLELTWCRIVGDSPDVLTQTFRETLGTGGLVFSFGGIGATPDDQTRQCVAQAAGVPLVRHPEAAAILEEKFGDKAYPQRILMADFPAGSEIVPNPFNQVPGFSLRHHYFFPGFPQMAWPMLEWVLDERYVHLHQAEHKVQRLVRVYGVPESEMVPLMEALIAAHPAVKLSSLPHIGGDKSHIEFGLRGVPAAADAALEAFKLAMEKTGLKWEMASQ